MPDGPESYGGGFAEQFFGPADRVRGEVEKIVERIRDQGEKALDLVGFRTPGKWVPDADVVETPRGVEVTLDVPGIDAESLNVDILGNMLTVSGTRPLAEPEAGSIVHNRHRPSGDFARSLPMPVPVDHESVVARLHEGVLTVELVRLHQPQARKVVVTKSDRQSSVDQTSSSVNTSTAGESE